SSRPATWRALRPPARDRFMASAATQNTNAGSLTLSNPTLSLVLGASDTVALVSISGNYQGLQLAFDGSADGGVTWNVPLVGIRTDRTAEDFRIGRGGFVVGTTPAAWRVAVAGLS